MFTIDLSGTRIPVLELDFSRFKNKSIRVNDDYFISPENEFLTLGIFVAPKTFFSFKHNKEWTRGILAVLEHLDMKGIWSEKDIAVLLGDCEDFREYRPRQKVLIDRLVSTWNAKFV
jgi:hypothetical protein